MSELLCILIAVVYWLYIQLVIKGHRKMARPVKETPVLSGSDARQFEKTIKENESRKVSREAYERALKSFGSIKLTTSNKAIGA
jgi:hypothetical protein